MLSLNMFKCFLRVFILTFIERIELIESSKEQHLFELESICYIINVFF